MRDSTGEVNASALGTDAAPLRRSRKRRWNLSRIAIAVRRNHRKIFLACRLSP